MSASTWAHDAAVPVPVEKYQQLLADEITVDALAGYLKQPVAPGEDTAQMVEYIRDRVRKVRAA